MKKILECEGRQLEKIKMLPYLYKKIGFVLLAVALLGLFVVMFMEVHGMAKSITWSVLLIAMLMISASREKVEDEYTLSLRSKSYMMAFIAGVLYAVVQPYINLGVANAINDTPAVYSEKKLFTGG